MVRGVRILLKMNKFSLKCDAIKISFTFQLMCYVVKPYIIYINISYLLK